MLADVDLSSCYAQVMGSMKLYAGRPVVHELGRDGESGSSRMRLKDAVEFVGQHAAGPDAWIIKVSGQIAAGPNVLSRHLPTNNVVAANRINATARALAFAMQLSLNGVQVVTDGCTYRRDQIPAGTLAECLTACPDYPLNRVDFKGPFVDPATIPEDDAAFTEWYREHVKRFFGVDGPDYDWLFGLHALEHKKCGDPERALFDALCCDGSANYIKLLRDGDGWKAAGALKDAFKARSFGPETKEALVGWLIQAYTPKGCRERRTVG